MAIASKGDVTVSLYILYCPLLNLPMYVGLSCNPKRRLIAHKAERYVYGSKKALWIRSLMEREHKPTMNVLATFDNEREAVLIEAAMIRELKKVNPDLLNSTVGGASLNFKFKGAAQRRTLVSRRDVEKLELGTRRTGE